tara:strand:- start:5869 stop:6972 length:1104 start_codon:yes stop_codon:yes gene_type:complete
MKFSIQRDALLKPLQFVIGVVERRQTLPILGNVLLTISDNVLSLVGTDLEVELIARVVLEGKHDNADITVPARKLMDICRNLPDAAQLDLTVKDQKLTVKSGRSRFSLATLDAGDFPLVNNNDFDVEISLSAKTLHNLFHQTHFAMAQQDVRYFLNGALLQVDGSNLTVVATDGHRLALATENLPELNANTKIIVPRKGVLELMKLLGDVENDVTLKISHNNIRVDAEDYTLTSKLVDGRYPDYQKVIPKGGDKELVINKDLLKQALTRVSVLSNEKYRGVRFELKEGLLRLAANNPEREEAEDEIEINYNDGDLAVGFNVNYVLDAINALDNGDIKLTLANANSSALIEHTEKNRESLYVVMPMRL